MSAAGVLDSSVGLPRLARVPTTATAPEMDGADSGLDLVLSACPLPVQGDVSEAAGLPIVARMSRAIGMWLGFEVGAVVGEGA